MPKTRQRRLPKPNLYLIIAILILIAGLIGFYLQSKSGTTLTNSKYCPAITDFYTAAKSAWPDTQIKIRDVDPNTPDAVGSPNLYFNWRTSSNSPYFGFNGEHSLFLLLPSQEFDTVDTTFQTKVIPELKTHGFALDLNNTIDAFESSTIVLKMAQYGFTKDNQKFEVRVATDEDAITIYIKCGTVDPAYLAIYTEIENAKKHLSTEVVQIWDLIDNVAKLNIGNIVGFGSGEYWNLTTNPPELLLEGQTYPECSLFESRKIGKGMECLDPTDDSTRPANY